MDRYIQCIVDIVKKRSNVEIDTEKLLLGALKGIFSIVSDNREAVNIDRIIIESVKGIFANIDQYGTFYPCVIEEAGNVTGMTESTSSFIKNDIGYLRIHHFNKNTYDSVCKQLDTMDGASVKKIILDLRYNNGGDFKQAVLTAGKFVPEGLIAVLKSNSAALGDIEYLSDMKGKKYKIAVLVNEKTASASEVLAGAIQDTKSGILIGTKTFGKAAVLKKIKILNYKAFLKARNMTGLDIVDAEELRVKCGLMPSKDEILGSALITVGAYIMPSGRMIDKTGLTPDIMIDNSKYVENISACGIRRLKMVSEYSGDDEFEDVFFAKAILKTAGYSIGKLDRRMDAATADAVGKFQSDKRLDVNGKLDLPTQEALNTLLETWVFQEDNQYTKAVDVLEGC
jgi:Periplasmic protease